MGGAAGGGGGFNDELLATPDEAGWKGLWKNKRSLGLAMFASLGGVLYGYNQGVFSSVQVMERFLYEFPAMIDNGTETVPTKGLVTAILELGAFAGSLMAGPLADHYSRKFSIAGWCIIFMLGTALQTGAPLGNLSFIWAGRWFAGMAVGALSMLVPMYNAELAPPGIRGSLVALQQLAITFGILVSYWIGYGCNFIGGTAVNANGVGQSNAAWRVPLGLQLIPAVVLCIGTWFLPFSPRWLMLKGREEESLLGLAKLRSSTPEDPKIQYEFRALQAERLVEREAAKERYGVEQVSLKINLFEYKRFFTTRSLLHRLLIGAGAQALQQWTGINAIIYYAPTIFGQIGLTGGSIGLLATGIVGIVNFVMTIPAVLFVDNFGRRPLLVWGEVNMAISHATLAAVIKVWGGRFGQNPQAGNGAVFMVYWFIANFAVTWGPLAWVVSAEVFPLDMRAKGMGISSAINWIMNFTVALTTPIMFNSIGFGTYLVFMAFCIIGVIYSAFLLPELKGLSLEEVDAVFKDTSGAEDAARRERIAKQIGLDKVAQEVKHKEEAGGQGKRFNNASVEERRD